MNRRALLEHLAAMPGDAAIERDGGRHFVATDNFHAFLSGRYHVIHGQPGSGKTAWARAVSEQQAQYPALDGVVVHRLPSHGTVLQAVRIPLTGTIDSTDYEAVWAAYLLNAVLDTLIPLESEWATTALANTQQLGMRCVDGAPAQRFAWCLARFGERLDEEGSYDRAHQLEQLMEACHQVWATQERQCWILIDGLDGSGLGIAQAEAVIAGLLMAQTQLHHLGDAIRAKVFLNARDSGRQTTWGRRGMVWARQSALGCNDSAPPLLDILGRDMDAITPVRDLTRHSPIGLNQPNIQFENGLLLLPPQILSNGKPRLTFDWMGNRLRDGNGDVSPRDFLVWVAKSAQVELRIDGEKTTDTSPALLSQAALEEGYAEMSRARIDRSFGPASQDHGLANLLRGGPRHYTAQDMSTRFGPHWKQHVRDLLALGLLDMRDCGIHVVPLLFRPGLDMRNEIEA